MTLNCPGGVRVCILHADRRRRCCNILRRSIPLRLRLWGVVVPKAGMTIIRARFTHSTNCQTRTVERADGRNGTWMLAGASDLALATRSTSVRGTCQHCRAERAQRALLRCRHPAPLGLRLPIGRDKTDLSRLGNIVATALLLGRGMAHCEQEMVICGHDSLVFRQGYRTVPTAGSTKDAEGAQRGRRDGGEFSQGNPTQYPWTWLVLRAGGRASGVLR